MPREIAESQRGLHFKSSFVLLFRQYTAWKHDPLEISKKKVHTTIDIPHTILSLYKVAVEFRARLPSKEDRALVASAGKKRFGSGKKDADPIWSDCCCSNAPEQLNVALWNRAQNINRESALYVYTALYLLFIIMDVFLIFR